MLIVDARDEHLPGIAAIYAATVESSPATFDLEAPDIEYWRRLLAGVDPGRGHFLIVALRGDEVVGYAKSGMHKERRAYDTTCEVSVYIAEPARGMGVGRALYDELLARLDESHLHMAVAGVTEGNPASERLHQAVGFEEIGVFREVGFKFGRAWSVRWYQRPLTGRGSPIQ